MYKKASKLGLRIQTTVGLLSVEQLWGLTRAQLANAVKAAKKELKKTDDDELSFLDDNKSVDTIAQLKFDILKDIYLTQETEAKEIRDAAAIKTHNSKIDALIAEKQDTKLRDMSIEELEALRK